MFLTDNFIHADCHAGNLLVKKLNKKKKNNGFIKEFIIS